MKAGTDTITITLPAWLHRYRESHVVALSDVDRMRFVIEAAGLNVANRTGGPFAAGVFESGTGRLVSLGVNLVQTQGMSVLHAEIVALMLAQKQLCSYDLSAAKNAPYTLVTSAEPCAMCLGAIPWSGLSRVVCGVADADVRSIGFDEGEKPDGWVEAFRRRGIDVTLEVCRDEAIAVLKAYRESGGDIYHPNARDGD